MATITAQAFANIAFIKYWGNRDNNFREALAFTKVVTQLPHFFSGTFTQVKTAQEGTGDSQIPATALLRRKT